jgi:hypothetical protein
MEKETRKDNKRKYNWLVAVRNVFYSFPKVPRLPADTRLTVAVVKMAHPTACRNADFTGKQARCPAQ